MTLPQPDCAAAFGAHLKDEGQKSERFYSMLEAAIASLGVAIAPEVPVRNELASSGLSASFGFAENGWTYTLLLPDEATPYARAFAD